MQKWQLEKLCQKAKIVTEKKHYFMKNFFQKKYLCQLIFNMYNNNVSIIFKLLGKFDC